MLITGEDIALVEGQLQFDASEQVRAAAQRKCGRRRRRCRRRRRRHRRRRCLHVRNTMNTTSNFMDNQGVSSRS